MGESVEVEGPRANILEEFETRLKKQWTREVACQRQCDPESCSCQPYIVHVAELEGWMKKQDTEESPNTKAGRLLAEMHDKIKRHRTFGLPLDSKIIFTGENRCLRVFSILLEQGRGDLIDIFYSAKLYDKYLDLPGHHHHAKLREKLLEKNIPDIDSIVQDFERAKWAYCSPLTQLTLHMEEDFEGGKVIMPFCQRTRVNEKGGTASVYWVAVQKDLVIDNNLRNALEKSSYNDPDFGPCYQMALKSYSKANKDIYDWEKAAFSGLKNDPNTPIVRYLGCYSHEEEVAPPTPEELAVAHGGKGERKVGEKSERPDGTWHTTTYNLLLEFGERDLEEYCADLTNTPPVRGGEIIRFWESLFKVAAAIEKVHNLRIPQGKKEIIYDGWHADIKPDNILRVNGEFKLADFGFAKFEERNGKGKAPTQYIEGGTDTYGAPEFTRERCSGTKTPMMQTIDTWSFGCVLSVAATWVVLGFQGIRQYTKLRTLAPSNRTEDGKITDRFHDGTRVLEEVKRWHTFLRGHLRTADTATPLVLDLIETQMLLTDPWTRSEAKPLCQELAKRVKQAKAELTALPLQMRETHDSVKLALWEMEKEAHNEDNLSRTDTTLLRRTARASSFASSITETNTLPQVPGPSHAVSKRVRKEAMIKNTPLAKTPYRQEILEEELPFLEKSSTAPTAGFHEGETTHSPVDDNPNPFKGASSASNSQGWNRRRAPRNPNTRPGPSQNTSKAPAGQTPSHGDHGPPRPPSDVPKLGKPSPRHHSPQPSKSNLSLANGFVDKPHRHVEFDSTVNSKQPESTSEPRDQSPDPSQLPTPDQTPSASPASIPQFSSLAYQNLSPRQTPALQETTVLHPMPDIPQQISTSPPNPDHCGSLGTAGSLSSVQNRNHSHLEPKTAPQIGGDEAGMIKLSQSPISDPKTSNPPETSPRSYSPRSPNGVNKPHDASDVPIIVTPEDDQSKDQKPFVSSSVTTDVKSGHTDKEIPNASNEEPWHDPESLGKSLAFTPLPTDVYQLPWEICTVRQVLDGKKPKTAFNKMVKSFMRVEEKDEHLAQFIHNRDLVFVIDNGTTMLEHWPILTFVAITLAMKVAGLDENGYDIKFTINGHAYDKSNLHKEDGIKKFRKALIDARPQKPLRETFFVPTDLNRVLGDIFREWWHPTRSQQKATTLIVLTDGIWKGTQPPDAIDNTVLKFAREVEENKRFGSRHFSIGFVRFGTAGRARLKALDDELCKKNNLEDIIDECSWKHDVNKMLLGSLSPYVDETEIDEDVPDGPNSPGGANTNYDLEALNKLFDDYNCGLHANSPRPGYSRRSSGTSSFEFERRGTDRTGISIRSAPVDEKKKKRISNLFSSGKK